MSTTWGYRPWLRRQRRPRLSHRVGARSAWRCCHGMRVLLGGPDIGLGRSSCRGRACRRRPVRLRGRSGPLTGHGGPVLRDRHELASALDRLEASAANLGPQVAAVASPGWMRIRPEHQREPGNQAHRDHDGQHNVCGSRTCHGRPPPILAIPRQHAAYPASAGASQAPRATNLVDKEQQKALWRVTAGRPARGGRLAGCGSAATSLAGLCQLRTRPRPAGPDPGPRAWSSRGRRGS
jgi:hypothetical protein